MKASTYIREFKKNNKNIMYIFSSEDPDINTSTAAIVCQYRRTAKEILENASSRYYVTTYYSTTDVHTVMSFGNLHDAVDHALHNIR